MNKINNRNKNFWSNIRNAIVAVTLSVALGVSAITACANSFVKLLERKKIHYQYLPQKHLQLAQSLI